MASKKFRIIIPWLPSILWMMVIFYFSSQPTAGVISTDPTARFYIYKSFHLIEYAILGVLLFIAAKKFKTAILIAYLYAISDEIHQFFTVDRTSKFTDTLIDLLGIIIGLLVFQLSKKIISQIKQRF